MASINKVILMGHVGRDPESRDANGGTICYLSIATSRRYKKDGQPVEETEWHRIVCFGHQANFAGQYIKKGDLVYIEGRIRQRKWTAEDGTDRYVTEIICEQIQGVQRADFDSHKAPAVNVSQGIAKQATPAPIDDSDVPF